MRRGTENNPLYGPPASIDEWERFTIGNALLNKVSLLLDRLAASTQWMTTDGYPPETIEQLRREDEEHAHKVWELMCKYVPDPLGWDYFTTILDKKRIEQKAGQ